MTSEVQCPITPIVKHTNRTLAYVSKWNDRSCEKNRYKKPTVSRQQQLPPQGQTLDITLCIGSTAAFVCCRSLRAARLCSRLRVDGDEDSAACAE
ncbi:hypothetical protein F2P81_000129 [Scophthalmus maximus]|uniref:Uncharacterized protein n=1 Tax=Scophthalmus maximus TaxID=52904 RepID=A0A6A4TFZ7_SCOMX|nr:hypothetical protein F2P81_000129 [Scophthalmus maximus]